MEVQGKPGANGTPATFPSPSAGIAAAPSNPVRVLSIILRGLAIVLTLIATILMGAAKQSRTFVGTDGYDNVGTYKLTMKSTFSSAYVYFIAANAIAFFFSTVSLALSIINRSGANLPLLSTVDLVIVALLFSCNGAASAIAVLAKSGNDKMGWGKFCFAAGKFCSQVTAAIVLSMVTAFAYLLLLLLSIIGFHKRSQ